jgi:ribonucleoside-diphosphate reductase alpha chain
MQNYYWLTPESREFLKRNNYLIEDQTPEERIRYIARYAQTVNGIEGFATKFEDYMAKGFYSLSTPMWSNFGLDRGLPISCYGSTIEDNMPDILKGAAEIGMLSKYGGGTAMYFGNLRPRGSTITNNGYSSGAIHFMELYEAVIQVSNQGNTRRGNMAAYLPVDHPDIEEFLEIKEEGAPIQHLSIGVCIPKGWTADLKDNPEKRKIWTRILRKRFETGYPYILFEGNVNDNRPQVYKDKDLYIKHSQLCSEILEISDMCKTFTCCLMSMNLDRWEDWKDTDAVQIATILLDTALTDFINRAKDIPFLDKAVNFARSCRSIGLGVLGWASLLQEKMIPFESMQAKHLTSQIFRYINNESLKASKWLATKFGEPEMLKGYGERFTTRIALAPTTSSSFILGAVSPSIEPLAANYFIKDLRGYKYTFRNPKLKEVLENHGQDTPETWKSILVHGGSVQHLDFLTEHERNVFKTFSEISPKEVIIQAAIRQKFIDQAQSLNLMIPPETSLKDYNKLILFAEEQGIKTLYYHRSTNAAQQTVRDINSCVSCEG